MENLPFFRPWKLFPCGKTMTFGLQRTRRRKRRKINTNEKWWKIKMNISSHGKSMASVFQRRIITNEKLPRNNRKLTFFPILKTFSSRKINFWPSKNEKKEKKLLKRMKNCLKNDGKSRRILPFLPVENRGGFCLSKKNHHEWKIERRNNGKFTGIDVTFFPILKNFFLAEGKSAASGLREEGKKKKKKKKKSSPVSGFRGETRARVVLLWRGGGAMAGVRSRIQKRRTSVGFGSRLATGRQLAPALSFPPPPIRVRLFPLLSALARLASSRASSIASTSVTPFRDSSRVHSLHGILPRNIIQDPSSHHPPNREKTSSSSSWMEWKRTWPRYIRECQILCLTWIIRIFGICFVQPKGLESSYSTQEEFYFILDLVYRFLFSLEKLDRSFLSLSLSNRRDREKLDRIDSSTTTASTIPRFPILYPYPSNLLLPWGSKRMP